MSKSKTHISVSHRTEGAFLVVIPHGRLDAAETPVFENVLATLLQGGPARVVVDCAGVSYASSAGLRVFLSLAKRTKTAGGCCRFARLSEPLRELFEISGFISVLEIHEALESAVQ